MPEFERRHPGVRVVVQQIPWTAAHEKLLTGFVGGAPPDLAQLGNTWIPEFAAIGALEPLEERIAASRVVTPGAYFEGIWKTNSFEGTTYGIPWYVDTRVLFYRPDLLKAAGYAEAPRTWSAWRDAMVKIRDAATRGARYAILLPTNEWEQLTIFAVQQRSTLLADDGTRGAFRDAGVSRGGRVVRRALSRRSRAGRQLHPARQPLPGVRPGLLRDVDHGPLEPRRVPPPPAARAAGPLDDGAPARARRRPGLARLLARGRLLARHLPRLRRTRTRPGPSPSSCPSRPSSPVSTRSPGDLPARREAWDDPSLGERRQGARLPRPAFPRRADAASSRVGADRADRSPKRWSPPSAGRVPVTAVLPKLDSDVDRILEKRRWILARNRARHATR